MGWFVFACILGFLTFWWRDKPLLGWRAPYWIIGAIIVAFVCWLLFIDRPPSWARAITDVGDGKVARFCVGFLLGIGFANAVWKAAQANWALLLPLFGVVLLLGLTAPHLDR